MEIKWTVSSDAKVGLDHDSIDLRKEDMMTIKLGLYETQVPWAFKKGLRKNTIILPIIRKFRIPPDLPFEVKLEGNTVDVGPVIAIVVPKENLSSFRKRQNLKVYLSKYDQINGLIYVCSPEEIESSTSTVKGYCFNPFKNNQWEYGVFPYPRSLFQRANIEGKTLMDLKKSGCYVFNANIINNKLEFNDWMHSERSVRKYIPYTTKLVSVESLKTMLNKFPEIYLKPMWSSLGRGIVKVTRYGQSYVFLFPLDRPYLPYISRILEGKKEERMLLDAIRLKKPIYQKTITDREALNEIVNNFKKHFYLVQQAIPIKQKRPIHFRIVMQKGQDGQWEHSASISQIGDEESIISVQGGYSSKATETLMRKFGLTRKRAVQKEVEMVDVCLKACSVFDQKGIYADLGFDVVLDDQLNVWILEVNRNHLHDFALVGSNDNELYQKVCTTPLLYAKTLARF